MRVLVTGHEGYIGAVMVPVLEQAGHEVVGLDTSLFAGCDFGPPPASPPAMRRDIRDVTREELAGFDAVIHLAGISNDPLGDLNPRFTYEINHEASVRLAETAKQAGVGRFLFASSCSLYGTGDPEAVLDEQAPMSPVTAYGESKVLVERDLRTLADDHFSPVYLRNATVYGASPRLRIDLVVNNLTGYAVATGRVLLKSDGTPWRPLVHVEDVSRAFAAVLDAPRDLVHDEAFNVGSTAENYRVRDVARIVEVAVEGSVVEMASDAGPDRRDYRVSCDKLAAVLPPAAPRWTVAAGVQQLLEEYRRHGLATPDLTGPRYVRLEQIKLLMDDGRLDRDLRWQQPPVRRA